MGQFSQIKKIAKISCTFLNALFSTIAFLILFLGHLSFADKKSKEEPSAILSNTDLKQKVDVVFTPILTNDDKKAKLQYGRNYRYLPEVVQFALDLRFKNFEHALLVLSQSGKSYGEVEFWKKIILAKPQKLSATVCEALTADRGLFKEPLAITSEEAEWFEKVIEVRKKFVKEAEAKQTGELSNLEKQLAELPCEWDGEKSPKSCESLSVEQQKIFLDDKFYDNLHNMQRRDTRFVQATYKNFVKLAAYKRYVTVSHLLGLYKAVEATEVKRKEHYLKRLGGIGRDIRTENLVAREVGNEMLADKKDAEFLARIKNLMDANPLLGITTGLGAELAGCGLTNVSSNQKQNQNEAQNLSQHRDESLSPSTSQRPSLKPVK